MNPLKFWKTNDNESITILSTIGEKNDNHTITLNGWKNNRGEFWTPPEILLGFVWLFI